jgi:trehalose 6-phosphate phosphatase
VVLPGEAERGALLAARDAGGIFTDFDGTLAKIVDDPDAARPLPGAADTLGALTRRFAVVGVVSGRPGAFLDQHFGGRGIRLWGLYGLQQVIDGQVVEDDDVARWRPVVEEVARRADAETSAGMNVERKGAAVTLHFRTAPGAEDFVRRWAEAEAERTGLQLLHARKSYELRPPVARDKGTVIETAATGLGAACFLGDDQGDLACFDALDRLARRGLHAVRVAVQSSEAPPELLARADVIVDGPDGALAWLEALASTKT